ncbi:MAG: hypothetical protein AUI14_17235 [Actinobacteria bacterium 13_2_20CM_2_71_6]|nr:MAG: hypothetical protein AUI14_17235 [Actinobacteria bacterium 13_2_20CM_2_71_6]
MDTSTWRRATGAPRWFSSSTSNFELRLQDVPLYNSVFRFDDDMFVTPHLYATPGASAPLLHLRKLGTGGLFSRFADHFDAIWATTTPLRDDGLALADETTS